MKKGHASETRWGRRYLCWKAGCGLEGWVGVVVAVFLPVQTEWPGERD